MAKEAKTTEAQAAPPPAPPAPVAMGSAPAAEPPPPVAEAPAPVAVGTLEVTKGQSLELPVVKARSDHTYFRRVHQLLRSLGKYT